MKKIKKAIVSCAIAAAIAGTTAVQMLAPLSASASVISPISGSAFQYEVVTQRLSTSGNSANLKLTIRFLNNPGIEMFGMNVTVGSGCQITRAVDPSPNNFLSGTYLNTNHLTAHFAFLDSDASTTNYEFNAYITVSNVTQNNQIEVVMDSYTCSSEGVAMETVYDDGITIPIDSSSQMMLGETNGNDRIDQQDAYNTLAAVNKYPLAGEMPVNYLRARLNVGTWATLLPDLDFAEAMDVDFDGYITEADSVAILNYHSALAVGNPDTSSPIGKIYYVNL